MTKSRTNDRHVLSTDLSLPPSLPLSLAHILFLRYSKDPYVWGVKKSLGPWVTCTLRHSEDHVVMCIRHLHSSLPRHHRLAGNPARDQHPA